MFSPSTNAFPRVPVAPAQLNFVQRVLLALARVNPSQLVAPSDVPVGTPAAASAGPVVPLDPQHPGELIAQFAMFDQMFCVDNQTRLQRYVEYDDLDRGDVASQLDTIRDAVLVSDDSREREFKVQVSKNAKIDNLVQDTLARTSLQAKSRQFLRKLLKYGDVPIALWFDSDFNITAAQSMNAQFLRRRVDKYGRLLAGHTPTVLAGTTVNLPNAYWQVSPLTYASAAPDSPIAGWYPWQMLWAKWRADDTLIYSHGSYLEDMRADLLKLRLVEAALVIARTSRAYPRRIYTLDVTGKSPDEKRKAIASFQKSLNLTELHNLDDSGNLIAGAQIRNPLDVTSDIFIGTAYQTGPDAKLYPQLNNVTLEDPRLAGIENISDIEFLRRKLYRRLPPALMGEEVNNVELSPQDLAADRMFQYCAEQLRDQIILPILRLQCALKGYTLDDKQVEVVFSNETVKSSWRHSDATFRTSMARTNSLANGTASIRGILRDEEHMTDSEVDELFAQVAEEQKMREKGVLPPIGNTAS